MLECFHGDSQHHHPGGAGDERVYAGFAPRAAQEQTSQKFLSIKHPCPSFLDIRKSNIVRKDTGVKVEDRRLKENRDQENPGHILTVPPHSAVTTKEPG
jgi:hypothetical protein